MDPRPEHNPCESRTPLVRVETLHLRDRDRHIWIGNARSSLGQQNHQGPQKPLTLPLLTLILQSRLELADNHAKRTRGE